ncbi:hypothetical protein [Chitinophaga filiformis]|uniref:Transposase n=1 Tax=Chitinophaga filiformis TaxID=104663 RepID=A0ABY4I7Z6_CHIFI|nr:hypothetical protein [Chitinophaga filiformis]UPK71369.1 hypothetical protein MYF79_08775 [Chitinophaga filiformis]
MEKRRYQLGENSVKRFEVGMAGLRLFGYTIDKACQRFSIHTIDKV